MDSEHGPDRRIDIAWTDPSVLYAAHEQMTSIDLFRAVCDGKVPIEPCMALLGAKLTAVEPGEVTMTLDPAEHHYDHSGTVQAGILAALTDTAAGYAIHTKAALGIRCATLELQVSLLEPITIRSGRISCVGRAISIGARTATAEAHIFDSAGRLCTTMSTSFIVLLPAGG
ncbi:MAG: hypothetical protein JWM91_4634 [Rhodospirillales bacterium]|nr:hypothetical protein [Rhodospirillales bacterium]